jgi:hypothetical protein
VSLAGVALERGFKEGLSTMNLDRFWSSSPDPSAETGKIPRSMRYFSGFSICSPSIAWVMINTRNATAALKGRKGLETESVPFPCLKNKRRACNKALGHEMPVLYKGELLLLEQCAEQI